MSDTSPSTTAPASSHAGPPAAALPAAPSGKAGYLVIAGVVGAAVLAWFLFRPAPAKEALPSAAITVEGDTVTLAKDAPHWQYLTVAKAEEGPPLKPLPVPGRVEFDEARSASVGAPLAGRIEKVLVRFGDRVKQGQRLLSVRSAAYADLDRELASAREEVLVKKRVVERIADLVKLQAAPEKEKLAAEAELKEAELALKAAQAKQSSLSVSADGDNLFWVTAPRNGTIVEFDVFASQEVGPDRDKPLMRISDLGEVLVIGDMAERDASDLKPGMQAQVQTELGSGPRVGTIERISEVVDPRRHTVEIRIRVQNEDRSLRPNAFVEVTPGVDESARFVRVPSEAVVTEGDHSVVFVQSAAGKMSQTTVALGRARDGLVEVRKGLAPGTPYVSKGALLLLNQVDLAR